MKRILDPSFRYRPSYATDLRKTFATLRRQMGEIRSAAGAGSKIAVLPVGRARQDRKK